MPVLLAESVINIEFADLDARAPITRPARTLPRAPGLHQSQILAPLARKLGYLAPGEKLEEEMPWRMALGVMWEEFAFSSILSESAWQPGELTVDDISVNCDGLGAWVDHESYQSDTPLGHNNPCEYACVDETKHTEKKVVDGDEFIAGKGFWMWQHQGRAYSYCYGPRVVRWTVMFYRGDWRGSGPVCKQFVVRFSEKEVAQTWGMLQINKGLAETEAA